VHFLETTGPLVIGRRSAGDRGRQLEVPGRPAAVVGRGFDLVGRVDVGLAVGVRPFRPVGRIAVARVTSATFDHVVVVSEIDGKAGVVYSFHRFPL
jgi:hypothetical protein